MHIRVVKMRVTYLIIYDITNDQIRNRLAEKLECYGLERIQYSAFMGKLRRYRIHSLIEDIKRILETTKPKLGEKRNVQIYPLYETNLKNRIIIDASKGKATIHAATKEERKIRIL